MHIKTTELLEFLNKAHKLNIYGVDIIKNDNGYQIDLRYNWDNPVDYYAKTVFITHEGESPWEYSEYGFCQMNDLLSKMLEEKEQKDIKEKEQKEIKEQKRQELFNRLKLTEEEKELLGIQ